MQINQPTKVKPKKNAFQKVTQICKVALKQKGVKQTGVE
jgi:hypothetical protein